MLQYYFITELWCNLLSRYISLTMFTFVRAKLQAVCENIDEMMILTPTCNVMHSLGGTGILLINM